MMGAVKLKIDGERVMVEATIWRRGSVFGGKSGEW